MGCAGSQPEYETPEMKEKQREIESQLRQAKKVQSRDIKLLLLGSGDSGKSTFAKQIRLIYISGFSDEERMSYRDIIHSNAIAAMRALVLGSEILGVPVEKENEERAISFSTANRQQAALRKMTPEYAEDIAVLWKDSGIQQIYKRSNEIQLIDSASYFLDNVKTFVADTYVPSEQDILFARSKTTGITETEFLQGKTSFRLVDVGGQRSERKKWIHCFQDVNALIFFVSLSEYNQRLYEDENVNRMHESVRLFDEICNSRWFQGTSIILFLNKVDLFNKKCVSVDLKCCFPEYTGGKDRDNALEFISEKFLSLNKTEKMIFKHVTCATDTEQVKLVFEVVKDRLIRESLERSGF